MAKKVGTVAMQGDTDGTQLTFANGTVDAKIVPPTANSPLGLSLGGQTVSTTTAAAVTVPAAAINTSITSAPLPSFSVTGAASATENSNAVFTVTLANPSATAATTVKYTLTNIGGATSVDTGDETISGTGVTGTVSTSTAVDGPYVGSLTFAPGATTATISLPVAFDALPETGEGISLTLSEPSAGTVSSTGASVTTTFADAPAPTFTMISTGTGVQVQEGNMITFTVTPSGIVTAPTTLALNITGQALGGITSTASADDFTTQGTISFAAGDTAAKTITVTVVNDNLTEGPQAYKASMLDSITYAEKASVTGVITDALPTLTLSQGTTTSVNEGGSQTYTVTASAAAPAGGLTVPYTVTGTATSGTDYTAPTGTVTIAAGQTTGTFTIATIADKATEAGAAETMIVTLGTTTGANLSTVAGATTATTSILDTSVTPVPGAVTLSSSAATVNEGQTITYTVELGSAAPAGGVTIPYTLSGTATLTTDYTGSAATTGNITVAAGATTGTLVLTTLADTRTDGTAATNETVILTLGTLPTGYTLATGTSNANTVTVNDTSLSPTGGTFQLTANNAVLTTTSNVSATPASTYLTAGNDTIAASTFTGAFVSDATTTDADVFSVIVNSAQSPTLANIETVNATMGGNTLTTTGFSGVNTINVDGATGTITTASTTFPTIALNSGYTGTLTVTAAAAGNTVGVTLNGTNNASLSTNSTAATVTVAANSTLASLTAGAGTLTLNGAGNLTITALNTLTALNASTMTGALTVSNIAAVTVTGGNGADTFTQTTAASASVNGSAGNDTFNFGTTGTLTTADTINGGDGVDTIVTSGYTTTTDLDNVTNVEVINLTGASLSYSYTAVDALVAFGQSLTINASGTTGTSTSTFSGAADTNGTFNITGTANNDALTGGPGPDTIAGGAGSDTITGGLGVDSINLGAADAKTDIVVMTTGGAIPVDTVSNFLVGSTTPDIVQVDKSDIDGLTTLMLAGNGDGAMGATVAAAAGVITNVSGAFDQGTAATTTMYTLSSTTAFTTTTLATALATGGSLAMTANGAWSGTESFLVAYDNNANTYLAYVTPAATANDAVPTSVTVTNILELTGVADASTFLTNNFQLIA